MKISGIRIFWPSRAIANISERRKRFVGEGESRGSGEERR
jgi:hypothetical protein